MNNFFFMLDDFKSDNKILTRLERIRAQAFTKETLITANEALTETR